MKTVSKLVALCTERPRLIVLLYAIIAVLAVWSWKSMRVDVFPDLTAPSITVMTEAPHMAPEETELLITSPIERALGGARGVRRTRSISNYGYSIVWADFDWGISMSRARQVILEKLQVASASLPPGIPKPVMAPESSVMGEFMTIGLLGDGVDPITLRDIAERTIRRRLLQIPGIAQVFIGGGDRGEWQVRVDQTRLSLYGLTADDVARALRRSGKNSSAGHWRQGPQESMIRIMGRFMDPKQIEKIVIALNHGLPVTIGRVAQVVLGRKQKRGEASINGRKGVVLTLIKQPGEDTLSLTAKVRSALTALQQQLPENVKLVPNLFNQAQFISTAINNVSLSLRNGAILVILVLFLFMADLRSAFISITALPLSLMLAIIAMYLAGIEMNTMTLGGLTLAIGVLIDDAIIGVENSWRHLRSQKNDGRLTSTAATILRAVQEVLRSVVFANILIILVFIPVFFIGGMEGRLIAPLGFAYIAANFASLVVSITLTPALSVLLVPHKGISRSKESRLVRLLRKTYRPILTRAIRHPLVLLMVVVALMAGGGLLVTTLGSRFLPPWNEGALNITAITLPGTNLAESDRLAREVEKQLLSVPEVVSTARKTGRVEYDEHAMEVNASEIEVALSMGTRSREAMIREIRQKLRKIHGMRVQIGQPLSHRIDHMLSGSRASLAIKVMGKDLRLLRSVAHSVAQVINEVEGVEDVFVERIVDLGQRHIIFNYPALAEAGLHSDAVSMQIERAFVGEPVGEVLTKGWVRPLSLYLKHTEASWEGVFRSLFIYSPLHGFMPLTSLAQSRRAMGPNIIPHENGQRRILVTANFSRSDTSAIVRRIRERVANALTLEQGVTITYGGQFESQQRSSRSLAWVIVIITFLVGVLFVFVFKSYLKAALLMLNLPFAAIGGVVALALTGEEISVASLLGFIALFGIAVRNGIILVTQYEHLQHTENIRVHEAVIKGTLERLPPVLMTALTSILALAPLIYMGDSPGNEIQAPMGIVIFGGLITSTLLTLLVFPTFYTWMATRFNWAEKL